MPESQFREKYTRQIVPNAKDLLLFYRCKYDLRLFAKVFLKNYCSSPFCDLHFDLLDDAEDLRRGKRKILAAPRGSAKSTIGTLVIPLHDLCYLNERYIVIASNTEEQAIQKLKDIRTEIVENEKIRHIFGNLTTNRPGSTEFICDNAGTKVKFQAVSSKKEVRGFRFREHRPTKIIIDDFEHSTEVESEELRDKCQAIFNEVFSNLGNKDTNILVVGTILHVQSLLRKLVDNPTYESSVYKSVISWAENEELWDEWRDIFTNHDLGEKQRISLSEKFYKDNEEELLKGTEVLWPEQESYLYLQKKIISDGFRAFSKEKQNEPMSDEEKIFFPEKIKYFVEDGEFIEICHSGKRIHKSNLQAIGACDPATGQEKAKKGKKGNFTCILSGWKDEHGRLFVAHDFTRRVPPSDYIGKLFELHKIFKYHKMGIETNLFRNLLVKNIRDEQKRMNVENPHEIRLPIKDIYQTEPKEKRIYTLEPKVEYNYIFFNKTNLSQEFWQQMFDFPKGDHDDAPDALEMLWSLAGGAYGVGAVSARRTR